MRRWSRAVRFIMVLALCVGFGLSASALAQQAYTLRAPVPAKVEHRGQSNVDLGDFYQVGGERIDLLRRADQLVVQLRASDSADVVGDLVAPSGPLAGFEAIRDFGNGLRMFANPALSAARMAPATAYASLRDTLSRLDADARVQFAVPVFVNAELGTYAVATDELLVRLKPGVRPETFFADARFARFEQAPASDAHLVRVAAGAGEPVLAVAAALQGDPRILWAEPNFYQERQRFFTPNDTLFPDQWHLNNTGQGGGTPGADAKLVPAWDVATTAGEGVVIAIVDDGPELTHPDLAIYTNPGEIAGNAIDDDGNGFVDDVSGWDFTSAGAGDNDGGPSVVADQHGTAVAGVAAARGNNAAGVTGAAFRATIFPSTIFVGPTATSDANIGAALAYASGRARTPGTTNWRGADIVNNSWGGGGPSTAINDALTWAATNGRGGLGTPHFFATGNFAPNPMWRPAALSGTIASVIAVGASNNLDVRSSYSQFGPQLDFVAPSNGGTLAVWTTDRLGAPGYNGLADPDYTNRFGGTSSATPLAAGVGALLLGLEPTLTIPQLRALMRGTTDRIGPLAYDANGFNVQYGYGRINAKQAVRALNHARVAVTLGATSIVSAAPLSRTTQAGETQTLTFSVRSVGQLDLNLSELQFTGPASFTLSRPLGATTLPLGQSTTFEVSFTSLTAGTFNATASFTTNDADLPTFTIPIQFTVSPVSIGGQVFEDRNGDGVIQSGESALAGFTVYLDLDNSGTMNPPTESTVNSAANLGLIFTNTTPTSHSLAASGLGSELQGLEVRVTLTHAHVSDVRLVLEAPDGRSIELVSGGQGGSFDNMTNTVFADDATVAIVAGTPPYTGRFRPNQPLSTFLVSNPNGSWTLRAFDIDYFGLAPQENGTLVNWSLTLRHSGEPRRTSNAVGVYTFLGLAPGNYPVRRAPSSGWSQVSPADAHLVTMVGNESNVGRHFGLARHDSVYGKVYDDVDGNGAFNPGTDTARAGATVFLDTNGNDALDATVEPNQITDSLGNFRFGNVSGSNSLRVIRPAGLRLSEPVTGSYPLSLAAGQFVQNRNFGLAPAGVTVTPTSGLTTTEAGGTATFTVVLNAQPTADVSIGLSSSDTTEGTVSPTSLTFTPANWNSAQTVTVAGVDDAVADGTVAYSIVTAAATSADTAYEGVNATDVSVSNTDNDVAGINVTPTGNLVTTEAGGTATFTVVLTSQPTADVSIGLSSSDTTEGTVNPTSLTFTPANWNTARTVTITGVDDAMVDGNFTYAILTAPATSADPAYAGIDPPNVGVNNTDNDVAGMTVTPSGGSTAVSEGGATDTYTLVLSGQPAADVTVAINPNAQVATSPTAVTFTAANWDTPQTVTVSAVNDAVAEGTHSGTIAHAVTSTDPVFNGLSVGNVIATITDNDVAGVVITENSGTPNNNDITVTEGGVGSSVAVVLTSQPLSDVQISLTFNPTIIQAGAPTPGSEPFVLNFTSANWNLPQTVNVSAINDNVVRNIGSTNLSLAVGSGDPNYVAIPTQPVSPIVVRIVEDDVAGVVITESSGTPNDNDITVTEGGAGSSVTVVLTSQPIGDVQVSMTFNPTIIQAGSPTPGNDPVALVFTSANWNLPQVVNVRAVNDNVAQNIGSTTLSLVVGSADPNYLAIPTRPASPIVVRIVEDDSPGVTVAQSGGNTAVTEGGATDTYTLVLTSQPTADVVVALASGSQLTATPSPLTFTSGNWNQPQTVTVGAVNDAIAEGTHSGSVTHTVTSADANYQGRLVDSVSVTITDNDAAGVVVTESGGSTAVTEGGATDTVSVVLQSQPQSNVTVTITQNGQLTVSPSPLTFTSANWNVAQVVTVTAANDVVVEGTHSGTLGFGVASSDPAYGAITLPSLTAGITDNDSAVVSFAPASVSQSETTSPMIYTLTLSNPVASGVIAKVNSTNGTAAAGADYTAIVDQTVTFAPNSTTAQTVSVAVTNDALDEDNETYTLTLSGINATGDVTLGAATATGTIEDDDALPVLSVANVTQPEGNATNTLNFTVTLSPVSGRAVSFTRATVDDSAISTGLAADFVAIAGGTVTIPAGQTSVEIPVTINGDATFEGDEQFTLSLTGVANATPGTLSATATLTEDDQQPTTTTITADLPDPSVVGQGYPVTVEVRAQTLSPLGAVTVTDGTGASCNAPLVAGTAPVSAMTCTLTSTSAGAKTLTASYTPASEAFAASSDTEVHTVNAAATSLVLLGPARARIGTAATYTAELSVTAPGSGTPAGLVTVSSGAQSCTITLPTATPSCTITYSTLGSRSISAVFAPSNSDYAGSTSNPVQTLVFASSDLSVTKTNAVGTYRPGDLLVYTVVVRNTGPDPAPQVRIRDVAPAGLTNVAWTCAASGSAICPDSGGTGTLDHVVATLPTGGALTYAYFGNVAGRPLTITNVAEVTLPVDTTIEDPNPANNSATDTDLLDDLFADGFEAPGINAESGGVRIAGASLRSTLDEVAQVAVRLSDVRGEALRVYARVVGGELQVALALRGADGSLKLGAWQASAGEPVLIWTATEAAGGWLLSGATLR